MNVASAVYLDASAIVKLVIREPESDPLADLVDDRSTRVTSVIADVEVHRAVIRAMGRVGDEKASEIMEGLDLIDLDEGIIGVAGRLRPVGLRALDAIHLASAMALGEQLASFVTYDRRLAEAARSMGFTVMAPGAG